MNQGILHAAAALDLISKMQDAHAQNLANAATVGYRKRLTSAEVFASALRQASGLQIPRHKEALDFGPGNLRQTGEPLDLAIAGDGFFTLATDRGERYTRAGAFTVDQDGFVVAANGARVAGTSGSIQLDPARGKPTIDQAGNVTQDGENVGALKIVAFERNDALIAESSGLFRAPDTLVPRAPSDAKVAQGTLEDANVNVVDELVQMIGGFRAFEAAQRSLLGIDRVRTQAVNGR